MGQPTQIINGQEYILYSPEWYAARQAEAQRATVAQGTAQGSALAAASKAAGIPISGSGTATSTASGTSSGSAVPARVPSPVAPSMAGLTAAASSAALPSGGLSTGLSAPSTGGSSYARLAPVDTSAAEAATFGRAKDQEGLNATASLTGLRSALGGRGMLGSGLEATGTANVVNSSAGRLSDVTRQQAITKAGQDNQNATTNFQGEISQRGQDIQREEAANSLAGGLAESSYAGQITQRGQDIQAANAAKALEIEQAQLASQQRSTALAGLEAALKVTGPNGMSY